ncbi:ABC transporter permease [Diplocloster hominis]|uniref:ABC transporter permease n=1 Tax=Diplocloster hominis TaxID=3079010 RepID=UPI0031BAAF89
MGLDRNNNRNIIKNIAKKDLHKNRSLYLFTCMTVALSVALVLTFLLYGFGSAKEKLRRMEERPQVTYEQITQEQLDQIRTRSDILWAGGSLSAGSAKVGTARLVVFYQDAVMADINELKYKGELPDEGMELMLPRDYLERLKLEAAAGDTVSLDLGDGQVRDYVLSGISEAPSKGGGIYRILTSQDVIGLLTGQPSDKIDAAVDMKNATEMSLTEATRKAVQIGAEYGISEDQVKMAESFFNQTSVSRIGTLTIVMLAAVAVLILLSAGIVIKNIFYISVAGKVREYGQLRTIGATQRQVHRLVTREGMILAARGIPFGLVLGGLMGYILVPKGWEWKTALICGIVCVLFGFAGVRLAVRKPARIAARTSPIEAAHYTGYTGKGTGTKNLMRSLNPSHLGVLNLKRSKKKTAMTMCSLVLAGILLGTICTFVVSYKPEQVALSQFPNGEFQVSLTVDQGYGADTSQSSRMKNMVELQKSGLMAEVEEQVQKIDGVRQIRPWYLVEIKHDIFQEEKEGSINGLEEQDFELLKQMNYEGPQTYEELNAQRGVILEVGSNSKLKENPVSIGATFHVTYCDPSGQEVAVEMPVIATYNQNLWQQENKVDYGEIPLSIMGSMLLMPVSQLEQLTGTDSSYGIEIAADPTKAQSVQKALTDLYAESGSLNVMSRLESMDATREMMEPMKIVLYVLAAFLIIFGIINLINTELTNLYSRRREIAVLQAVGMTKRQVSRMLSRESTVYTVVTIAFTVIVGSLMGYGMQYAMENALMVPMEYTFPVIPVLLYVAALLGVQFLLGAYGTRMLARQPLVERIRQAE